MLKRNKATIAMQGMPTTETKGEHVMELFFYNTNTDG